MTAQEVVQALRCCADHSCSAKCPAFPTGLDCREEMHKEVLALIERLSNRWRGLKGERRIHEAILPLLRKCLSSR